MQCDASLKNLTALFVEDEESLLQLLVSALGSKFRKYEIARDGAEGLEVALKLKPDIIISDITMPIMDGLSMAEEIHKTHANIPVIILSAYSDRDKLLHAIETGITKYFIKPFDPDELLEYLCVLAEKIDSGQKIRLVSTFIFDRITNKLLSNGNIVKLTTRELELLAFLLESPNHMISNDEIKVLIGKGKEATDENVRVFIRRLREKTDRSIIQNLPKQGYALCIE